MMKSSNTPVALLAAAVLGLALPASTMIGSNPGLRMSAEYSHAVDRADKDYETANRRCEVLGMDERKLCQHDSTVARSAAMVEAQPGLRISSDARTGPESPATRATK
jgi:hypothetical protein